MTVTKDKTDESDVTNPLTEDDYLSQKTGKYVQTIRTIRKLP